MNACTGWKKTATPYRSSRYTGPRGWNSTLCIAPTLWSVLSDARVTDRLLIRRDNGWVLADGTQRDNQTEYRAFYR